MAVESPHLREPGLKLGDQIRIAHDFVELTVLLHHVDLDPQVVDDETPQGADRGSEGDDRRRTFDRGVGVAERVTVDPVDPGGQILGHRTIPVRDLDDVADVAAPVAGARVEDELHRVVAGEGHGGLDGPDHAREDVDHLGLVVRLARDRIHGGEDEMLLARLLHDGGKDPAGAEDRGDREGQRDDLDDSVFTHGARSMGAERKCRSVRDTAGSTGRFVGAQGQPCPL